MTTISEGATVEDTSPFRLVHGADCPHCHDLLQKHPNVGEAAPTVEVNEQKCGPLPNVTAEGQTTCYTGLDLLKAANVDYTPACVVTEPGGTVRECTDREMKAVLKGEIPALDKLVKGRPFEGFYSDLY